MLCGGFPSDRNRGLGVARVHEIPHPFAIVLCATAIPRHGLLYRCRAPVVPGFPTPFRFDMKCIDKRLASVRERASDCLSNMNTIQIGAVIVVLERRTPPLEFAGRKPVAKELDEQAEVLGLVVLDLDADPHQRLRELAEGVASGAHSTDESGGSEFANLLGGGLVRHQAGRRYVLDGRGLALEAQELDDLALGRGELTHPVLIVGRQIIDHLHERTDEVLKRLLIEEIEQDDVGPVVAGGEMMDGPRAGAAERGAEEFRELRLALVNGFLGEQLKSGVKVNLLQHQGGFLF